MIPEERWLELWGQARVAAAMALRHVSWLDPDDLQSAALLELVRREQADPGIEPTLRFVQFDALRGVLGRSRNGSVHLLPLDLELQAGSLADTATPEDFLLAAETFEVLEGSGRYADPLPTTGRDTYPNGCDDLRAGIYHTEAARFAMWG